MSRGPHITQEEWKLNRPRIMYHGEGYYCLHFHPICFRPPCSRPVPWICFIGCPLQCLKRAAPRTIGFSPPFSPSFLLDPHYHPRYWMPWIGQWVQSCLIGASLKMLTWEMQTIGRWWWALWLMEETLESQGCGKIEPYLQRVNKGSRLKENWEQMCKEKQRWGAMLLLRGRWTHSRPRVTVGPGPGIASRAPETPSVHSCWASSPLASNMNLWHGWLGQQGNVYCDVQYSLQRHLVHMKPCHHDYAMEMGEHG